MTITPKRMSTSQSFCLLARIKRSINNLAIIPLVRRLLLLDKVPLTYRQVFMIK